MEGLLQLESKGFLKKTKKYFFKLTDTELQYCKEDDKTKVEGSLLLDGAFPRFHCIFHNVIQGAVYSSHSVFSICALLQRSAPR